MDEQLRVAKKEMEDEIEKVKHEAEVEGQRALDRLRLEAEGKLASAHSACEELITHEKATLPSRLA